METMTKSIMNVRIRDISKTAVKYIESILSEINLKTRLETIRVDYNVYHRLLARYQTDIDSFMSVNNIGFTVSVRFDTLTIHAVKIKPYTGLEYIDNVSISIEHEIYIEKGDSYINERMSCRESDIVNMLKESIEGQLPV